MEQLKSKDIKPMRENLHKEQNMKCPICKQHTELQDTTLDHQHKLFKDQPIGENGAGMIRGVLCFQCNALEGKIFNAHRRLGLHKKDNKLSDILRGMADYLDRENLPFIHPSEAPKALKLMRSNYNKLKKLYNSDDNRKKFPDFPKSGKLTKGLEKIYKHYEIEPKFYS